MSSRQNGERIMGIEIPCIWSLSRYILQNDLLYPQVQDKTYDAANGYTESREDRKASRETAKVKYNRKKKWVFQDYDEMLHGKAEALLEKRKTIQLWLIPIYRLE